ncbi:MAG: DNA/RNA nuclease SfsA [Desulfohalobiaceae bacterium]|nr:DNA/RNA nuclease SfsA [Desulfohalobiaceae bacterium]
MELPPLSRARLVRRRNRFVAEADLDDGTRETVYCPNTGRMLGCSEPGSSIFLSKHDGSGRKHRFTWELTQAETSLVGVNTARTNAIVREGIETGKIINFGEYVRSRPEVKLNAKTRLDFRLESSDGGPSFFLEVKNCTLVRDGVASFPDAVSKRGTKHLQELIALAECGYRAAVLFLVQRTDAECFVPARDIDPEYSLWLDRAASAGVDVLCYDVCIDLERIEVNNELPVYQ